MTQWRKSSRSASSGQADCVELARLPRAIALRDSKAPEAGHLTLPTTAFAELITHLKRHTVDT